MVGERGFEPPTPWSRTRCSTRLSHSPTCGVEAHKRGAAWRVVPLWYACSSVTESAGCKWRANDGGGGGSRTFPQGLESITCRFYEVKKQLKVPKCRIDRTRIVHGPRAGDPPPLANTGVNGSTQSLNIHHRRPRFPCLQRAHIYVN